MQESFLSYEFHLSWLVGHELTRVDGPSPAALVGNEPPCASCFDVATADNRNETATTCQATMWNPRQESAYILCLVGHEHPPALESAQEARTYL